MLFATATNHPWPPITVDGIEFEIRKDERLNAIEAAARAGVEIPHYCWHPGLSVVGSCRMCLVEVGTRDAFRQGERWGRSLVPACNTQVRDGTVIATQSEKVQHARALVEEGLAPGPSGRLSNLRQGR